MIREITDVARRHLAEHGAAMLSLRAIARELGMVSSALYRYFPNRDDLLTTLIIDAYNAVGSIAEQAESSVRRADFTGRWMAVVRAVRRWATENPQEYALIFGSPVLGYRAPPDTIDPAARIPLLLLQILTDAAAAGREPAPGGPPMPKAVRADLRALRDATAATLTEVQLARAAMAWTELIGSISFELFGHLNNVVHDYEAYFDYQMRGVCQRLGLT
jgi:AcrR family transcriptional regulator